MVFVVARYLCRRVCLGNEIGLQVIRQIRAGWQHTCPPCPSLPCPALPSVPLPLNLQPVLLRGGCRGAAHRHQQRRGLRQVSQAAP
jgi:hypothetical protein